MENLTTELQDLLQPSEALIGEMKALEGDILILGAGGKIGPSLALLARRTMEACGKSNKVIGVSRFSDPGLKDRLDREGVITLAADLLDPEALKALPHAANVCYLAGTKFGTTGGEPFTWAMNAYLPGAVAEKYKTSRIVAYSTGNVYPFTPAASGGADEDTPPAPVGEYAQSCLGRERIFQYFSQRNGTPLLIFRLNYANDLRYGVLVEIAQAVRKKQPVNLQMGQVNVIWQGDSNEMTLRSLLHCSTPATLLNVTGPETVSVRWLAGAFGKLFNTEPLFAGEEQPVSLLNNASEAFRLFGYPRVSLKQMIRLTAEWLVQGGATLDKPTHFQERTGQF